MIYHTKSSRYFVHRFFLIFSALALLISGPANAERLKDIGSWQGVRSNQLTGYGIVVGLAGTGDDSLIYATQGVKGSMARFGMETPAGVNPALKNSAAVIVTAELPPYAKPGQRLSVTVSSVGKAKSLRGGTLLMAPLYGADGQIYAVAQGNLVVGGLGVEAADGSKLSVNVPSVGRIDAGATVEREVAMDTQSVPQILFNLNEFDSSTAVNVETAINGLLGPGTASAIDGRTIAIRAPVDPSQRVQVMGMLDNLDVARARPSARIVINARTGTVVINGEVTLNPVAITHGKLVINVDENPLVIPERPRSRRPATTQQSSTITVVEETVPVALLPKASTLEGLVNSLNLLNVTPGDLVAIFQALKEAGALNAELIIL